MEINWPAIAFQGLPAFTVVSQKGFGDTRNPVQYSQDIPVFPGICSTECYQR